MVRPAKFWIVILLTPEVFSVGCSSAVALAVKKL
jgi:hypothetical protein